MTLTTSTTIESVAAGAADTAAASLEPASPVPTDSAALDPAPAPSRGFEDSEGLRALLIRLHEAGPGAWRTDPDAKALMAHTADRYTPLARKYGLDPWEAASAAFEVMRARATRLADHPWRMVTRAVEITCIAEHRAQGLLCSTHQARRPKYSVFHDPERFSDRENPLTDYHPSLRTRAFTDDDQFDVSNQFGHGIGSAGSGERDGDADVVAGRVRDATADTLALFVLLGWEEATARAAIDYVTTQLAQAASRASAYEALRRSRHARAFLDLPGRSWTVLLRVLLGNPDPHTARTNTGRGVLLRLLVGEPLTVLLGDDNLVAAISEAAPRRRLP